MIGAAVLCTVTLVAVGFAADVIITTRRVERGRPEPSGDWGCDHRTTELANDVFHFGTDTTKGQ